MSNTELNLRLQLDRDILDLKFQLDRGQYTHNLIYGFLSNNKLFEPQTSALLLKLLKPGDIFIDVGSHIGYFAMIAGKRVGPEGRVYCFEPEQGNHDRLLQHLRLNEMNNVLVFPWAVAAQNGFVDLYLNPRNDGGHTIWDLRTLHKDEMERLAIKTTPVPVVCLDELFGNHFQRPIQAIKIDVEGAEMEVLRGARSLLSHKKAPLVICECNRRMIKQMGTSEAALRNFMTDLGYDVYAADLVGSPTVLPLKPQEYVESNYVFNLAFMRPEFTP